jgi:hypothetical protein
VQPVIAAHQAKAQAIKMNRDVIQRGAIFKFSNPFAQNIIRTQPSTHVRLLHIFTALTRSFT